MGFGLYPKENERPEASGKFLKYVCEMSSSEVILRVKKITFNLILYFIAENVGKDS